jgi:hypothetical protein
MMYSTLASGFIRIGLLTSIGMTLYELTKMPKMQLPKDKTKKSAGKPAAVSNRAVKPGNRTGLAQTRGQEANKIAAKKKNMKKKR